MLLQKAFTHLLNRATQNNVFKVIMKLQSNFLLENNFPCCFFNLLKKSNCVSREIKHFFRYQIRLQKEFALFLLLISHHSRFQTLRTVYQLSEYIQAKTQINYTSAVCYLVLEGKFCFFTIILQHCVKNFFFKKIF